MTREEATKIIEARMFNGEPFTIGELPLLKVDDYEDYWRLSDALIQKHRRGKMISYERKGRAAVWSLTPYGRAVLAEQKETAA